MQCRLFDSYIGETLEICLRERKIPQSGESIKSFELIHYINRTMAEGSTNHYKIVYSVCLCIQYSVFCTI